MNLQVMFGNPIKGAKKGKSMAKKKTPKVRKGKKTTRRNPQEFIAQRGIDKVVEGRIATTAELANMRKTIADAIKNKAGAKTINALQSDYEDARRGVSNVLQKRKTAKHYHFNKFKTKAVEASSFDKKATEKSIKRNLTKKKMKEMLLEKKKHKKGAKGVGMDVTSALKKLDEQGGVVAKSTKKKVSKKASKKVAKKATKKTTKKASKKKTTRRGKSKAKKAVKKLAVAVKPITKKASKKKASKKKVRRSKKARKAVAVTPIAKKAKKTRKTRRKASKKVAKKVAPKKAKTTKKVSKKKASKKVSKKKSSKKASKVKVKATPKKAKKARKSRKNKPVMTLTKGKKKVSRKSSKKSVRRNPIGGNMAKNLVAKTDAFMNKNLGHKLAEAAGLFGGGVAVSGIQHVLNVPAVKAIADKLDAVPYVGPALKKNLDVLVLLGLGVAGLRLSKNSMVQDGARGIIGASVVTLGSRTYNTGMTFVAPASLPTTAQGLAGIKAVPNFGAIRFDAPNFGAIKEASEFGGVIDRPAMFATALAESYVDSTYEMEPESDF